MDLFHLASPCFIFTCYEQCCWRRFVRQGGIIDWCAMVVCCGCTLATPPLSSAKVNSGSCKAYLLMCKSFLWQRGIMNTKYFSSIGKSRNVCYIVTYVREWSRISHLDCGRSLYVPSHTGCSLNWFSTGQWGSCQLHINVYLSNDMKIIEFA